MCVMWFNESTQVLASTVGACEHLNCVRVSRDADIYGGSHSILRSEAEGVVTCCYTRWVEEIRIVCTDCGHSEVFDILYHQKHDKCGINY